jgi:hypothetical protein
MPEFAPRPESDEHLAAIDDRGLRFTGTAGQPLKQQWPILAIDDRLAIVFEQSSRRIPDAPTNSRVRPHHVGYLQVAVDEKGVRNLFGVI